MKNFKTFGGCSTALLAAFILTPSSVYAQAQEDPPCITPMAQGTVNCQIATGTGAVTPSANTDGYIHTPNIPGTTAGTTALDAAHTAAGGTDIVVIGDGATVEKYFGSTTTPGTPGAIRHTLIQNGGSAIVVIVEDVGGVATVFYPDATNPSMSGLPFRIGTVIQTVDSVRMNRDYELEVGRGPGTDGTTANTPVNPKAIAIGSSSVVRGDDSIAVGPGAVVVRVDTIPGAATHMYDPDGAAGVMPIRGVEIAVDPVDGVTKVYELGTIFGVRGDLIETLTALTVTEAGPHILRGRTDADELTRRNVDRATAVGADSSVAWNNGVAIGAGANVGTVDNIPGAATHTYDSDGAAGDIPSRPVEVVVVEGVTGLYEVGAEGRGDFIGTLAELTGTEAGPYTLVGITGTTSPAGAQNGVAIGADASVTGEGGIAIGGGTGAFGDDSRTTVTAGANEIAIGGDNHDGAINIGNIDLRYEQDRITTNEAGIATNVEGILNNGANIKVNRDNIATNKNDIETNTKGIASAIAIAGLATGPGSGLSIGFGSFQSETSIAIGYDNTFGAEQNMTFKAAAASAGSGSTAGSLSMRWAF